VGGGQCIQHPFDGLQRLTDGQHTSAAQQGTQVGAVDELHREVVEVVGAALVVHADHTRVRQPGRSTRLATEPGGHVHTVGQLRVHDLQCHHPVQPAV